MKSSTVGFFATLAALSHNVLGQGCPKTHPFVGFSGNITTIEPTDALMGIVTVIDDCTFQVTSLHLQSGVPKVFWWGDVGGGDPSTSGFRVCNEQLSINGYTGADVATFVLDAGKTWNDFNYIFGYCEDYKANLAQLALGPGSGPGTTASTAVSASATVLSSSSPSPSVNAVTVFDNCLTLFPGIFNIHWTLDRLNDAIEIGLEIVANQNNTWAGFGISDPTVPQANMIDSDPIITGVLGNTPFAMAYYISLRSQCNYAVTTNQTGVCPDQGNNTRLVGSYFTTSASGNNVRLVRYRRSLSNSSAPDVIHTINPDVPMYTVFAYGPLSEDPTKPVVLYHGPNGHANTSTQIQFGLNPGHLCQPLSQSSIPPPSTAGGNASVIQTINNATTFTVMIGTNKNYPNPPGWGESYHINGLETPVLNVTRGTTYTFIIEAGPTHPLYITSSIRGGHSETNETIYAGGGFQFAGNATNPAILTWMPTQSTPDLVYYMCYNHQKIGWKINVKEAGSASGAVVRSHANSFIVVVLAMIGAVVMLL